MRRNEIKATQGIISLKKSIVFPLLFVSFILSKRSLLKLLNYYKKMYPSFFIYELNILHLVVSVWNTQDRLGDIATAVL